MQSESSFPADAQPDQLTGMIIDGSRGIYRVETDAGVFTCTIRGKLRKSFAYPESANGRHSARQVKVNQRDPVAIGNRVTIQVLSATTGVIEAVIATEAGSLTRGDPDYGATTSVAGLDRLIVVFAARDPAPHLRLLDRFIVLAEAQGLELAVCLNKCDLGEPEWLSARLAVYARLGYPVVRVSATTGAGIADLRALVSGRTAALVGPSGVGKSSVLNALEPGLAQRVGATSNASGKGRHTTTSARMVSLAGGGHLADTAGIRALAFHDLARPLDQTFREFTPYLGRCRWPNCAHLQETDCAIRQAVATGEIDRERYSSYARLRDPAAWQEDIWEEA